MSDSSLNVSAIVHVPVVAGLKRPFDNTLAETQPLDLADVSPRREEKLA